MLAFVFLAVNVCGVQAAQKQMIRVGFYPLAGFHEYDNNGEVSGYDIEYLNRIGEYANLDFSFAGVNSKAEALQLMEQGTLDMVGGMPMTADGLAKYRYCSYPSGETTEVLTVLNRNMQLSYEDFSVLNGRPIGCTADYEYKQEFLAYAAQHQFEPSLLEYANIQDARQALESGAVDGIIENAMEVAPEEKIVGRFSPRSFYYVMNPNQVELAKKMDDAVKQLQLDDPDFQNTLSQKYFPKADTIAFTSEEMAFMNLNPTITIHYMDAGKPVLYQEGEQPRGIIYSILEKAAKKSDITLEYVFVDEENQTVEEILEDEKNVVAGLLYSNGKQVSNDLQVTIPILKSGVAAAGKKGNVLNPLSAVRAAIPEDYIYSEYLQALQPEYDWQTYPTIEEALEAVASGKADYAFYGRYQMELALNHHPSLALISVREWQERYPLTLSVEADPQLVSVLNKSIRNLSPSEIDQSIVEYMVSDAPKTSNTNFGAIAAVAALAVLAVGALGASVYLKKIKKEFQNTSDELHKEIVEKTRLIENISRNINGGVLSFIPDAKCTITYADAGFLKLIGCDRKNFEKNMDATFYVHPEDVYILNRVVVSQQIGETVSLELRLRHKNITFLPILLRGTMIRDEDNQSLFYCVVTDMTKQHKVLESLEKERYRYSVLLEQFDDIIFDMDEVSGRFTCAKKFPERLGWRPGTFPEEGIWDALRVFPRDIDVVKEAVQKLKNGSSMEKCKVRIEKSNKEYEWFDMELNRMSQVGKPLQMFGKLIDVAQQAKEEEYNEVLAERDHLTGLYTEGAFQAAVQMFLQNGEKSSEEFAVVSIELDNFKTVNEQLGRKAGDIVLRESAGILTGIFGEEGIVARVNGDEFCVFLQEVQDDVLDKKVQQSCDGLCRSYAGKGKEPILITTSVGVFKGNAKGLAFEDIMRNVETALDMAKIQDTNIVYYQDTL